MESHCYCLGRAYTSRLRMCYRTALRFFITYLGLLMSIEKKLLLRICNAMRKMHAEIGCGNSALGWQRSELQRRNRRVERDGEEIARG